MENGPLDGATCICYATGVQFEDVKCGFAARVALRCGTRHDGVGLESPS